MAFENLNSLETLSIQNNKLTTISEEVVEPIIDTLRVVDIMGEFLMLSNYMETVFTRNNLDALFRSIYWFSFSVQTPTDEEPKFIHFLFSRLHLTLRNVKMLCRQKVVRSWCTTPRFWCLTPHGEVTQKPYLELSVHSRKFIKKTFHVFEVCGRSENADRTEPQVTRKCFWAETKIESNEK